LPSIFLLKFLGGNHNASARKIAASIHSAGALLAAGICYRITIKLDTLNNWKGTRQTPHFGSITRQGRGAHWYGEVTSADRYTYSHFRRREPCGLVHTMAGRRKFYTGILYFALLDNMDYEFASEDL